MIIIGIDPGTATTGYGVIEAKNSSFSVLDYGCVKTFPEEPMPDRLRCIFLNILTLVERFCPTDMAVEKLFFNTNSTTAISVGQARGVVLLAASEKKLALGEYTPLQVKQAMVGYGRADKKQVQYMVTKFLGLAEVPKPDDAADALAIAICHAHCKSIEKLIKEKQTGDI